MKYLIILATLLSASTIPYKEYGQIVSINGNVVTTSNSLEKNVGAIVVRLIDNKRYITSYLRSLGGNKAKVVDKDFIDGKGLANIKPAVKVGDEVISAFLYDKILIIAPNKDILRKVEYKLGVNSIDPDLFYSFIGAKNPSRRDYKKFAKMVGVGLILVVKGNTIELYDPISNTTIKKIGLN